MIKSIEITELLKGDCFIAIDLCNYQQYRVIITCVFEHNDIKMIEIEKDNLESIEILQIPYYEFPKYFKVLTIENVGV